MIYHTASEPGPGIDDLCWAGRADLPEPLCHGVIHKDCMLTLVDNARFVGFECVNRGDGKDPWPEVRLDAIARAAAAVCRHYGWSAESVIGHLEWTN